MLAHDELGQGRPVVLLHAFPLCRAMWRPQHAALASVCRLITVDLPGFGNSPLLDGAPTLDSMADAVDLFLDRHGVEEPIVLGGLSMGGYLAFAFARRYPGRLAGLILADTRAEPDDATGKANRDKLISFTATNPARAVVEQMIPKLLGPAAQKQPALVEEVLRMGSEQRPAGIITALHAMRDRPDSTPTLAQIKVPTLVLVGSDDALTPPEAADHIARGIAGAIRLVLPQAGHLSNLEQPKAFNDAVVSFLGSMPTPR